MVVIVTLGQLSDNGLAMMDRTVTTDQPHGLVHEFMTQGKTKYKPEDVSAGIKMDDNLDKLEMRGTVTDFYNSVIGIQATYGCKKMEINLITVMVKKNKNSTYANNIIDHLNDVSKLNNFEALYKEITAVQ